MCPLCAGPGHLQQHRRFVRVQMQRWLCGQRHRLHRNRRVCAWPRQLSRTSPAEARCLKAPPVGKDSATLTRKGSSNPHVVGISALPTRLDCFRLHVCRLARHAYLSRRTNSCLEVPLEGVPWHPHEKCADVRISMFAALTDTGS